VPNSAGNMYQGLAAKVRFIFDATQIENNGWDESPDT